MTFDPVVPYWCTCISMIVYLFISLQTSLCNGGSLLYAFNPMTGSGISLKPTCLPQILQTTLLPVHDHTHSRILLMLTKDLKVCWIFMYTEFGVENWRLVYYVRVLIHTQVPGGMNVCPLYEYFLPSPFTPAPVHPSFFEHVIGNQLSIIIRSFYHSIWAERAAVFLHCRQRQPDHEWLSSGDHTSRQGAANFTDVDPSLPCRERENCVNNPKITKW